MKISEADKIYIRNEFGKLKTKEQLLQLLNKAKVMAYGEKTTLIKLNTFSYYANPQLSKKRYITFKIKKKSGKLRSIHAPVNALKQIQSAINEVLQCVYEPHDAVTGFIQGKSIVDNAKKHVAMHYVFNMDLKDFFPSIDMRRVQALLKLAPYNLTDTKEQPLAYIIANLCSAEMEVERKNKQGEIEKIKAKVLPQGAPTSPVLSNMICNRLDRKLNGVAKRFGLNYSRYADDITFSSMHNVYQQKSEFTKEIYKIIKEQNFDINEQKTRLQRPQYKQEVTGLTVNEKVNTPRRYLRQIRMWLYYWENYGYEKANQIFLKDYLKDKGHVKKKLPNFINVLDGKLQYLKMVKGEDNAVLLRLSDKLMKLLLNYSNEKMQIDQLESVLNTWELNGIEDAIKLYNKMTKPNG
jgi:hypothetical protein